MRKKNSRNDRSPDGRLSFNLAASLVTILKIPVRILSKALLGKIHKWE
jgi:hypothetical protein